jgi:hypothetical protein
MKRKAEPTVTQKPVIVAMQEPAPKKVRVEEPVALPTKQVEETATPTSPPVEEKSAPQQEAPVEPANTKQDPPSQDQPTSFLNRPDVLSKEVIPLKDFDASKLSIKIIPGKEGWPPKYNMLYDGQTRWKVIPSDPTAKLDSYFRCPFGMGPAKKEGEGKVMVEEPCDSKTGSKKYDITLSLDGATVPGTEAFHLRRVVMSMSEMLMKEILAGNCVKDGKPNNTWFTGDEVSVKDLTRAKRPLMSTPYKMGTGSYSDNVKLRVYGKASVKDDGVESTDQLNVDVVWSNGKILKNVKDILAALDRKEQPQIRTGWRLMTYSQKDFVGFTLVAEQIKILEQGAGKICYV